MDQEDICRELLGKIIDGEISPGAPLPPEEPDPGPGLENRPRRKLVGDPCGN